MSAFIEKEWGPEAYQVMKRLKKVVDPGNLLNPGIIITDDPLTHVHHLKVMPTVEEEVDKCIECGFCEQVCPSRDITLTPRRRIGVRRAMKRMEEAGDHATRKTLLEQFEYDGMETCAVDGMCATNCPVDINTGDLIKRLRRENHSTFQNNVATWVAKHFYLFENTSAFALKSGFLLNRVLGRNFMKKFTGGMNKIVPGMPVWSNHMRKPGLNGRNGKKRSDGEQVVYFSSCISRMMGGENPDLFFSVCGKANVDVIVPANISGTCCGQIFSSKGFSDAFRVTANQTINKLWESTDAGRIPIVLDVTSCTQTLGSCRNYLSDENKAKFDRMKIVDIIDFAALILVPRLKITRPKDSVVFHPVCSVFKMGSMSHLQTIGNACAKKSDIPFFAKCCGMAGDRGFYFPELTAAATKQESNEVKQHHYDGYYSSSRTCEMALSEAVGHEYHSILKLLDDVSSE